MTSAPSEENQPVQ
jgi:serine/threonine protein kinase